MKITLYCVKIAFVQVREKFLSLRKNTKLDIAVAIEEVHAYSF